MDTWGITHNGKVRSINQDVYKLLENDDQNIAVLVVCDGMGGANAGNIASELAADTFSGYINERIGKLGGEPKLDDIADIVTDAAVEANKVVYAKGMDDVQCSGMGTTLVALVSSDAGEVVANVGDSRAYHITPNGISQVTKDHSVVEDMIDRGEITRKEALRHPRKNLITRAIGADMYVEPDIYTQNIDSGDIVLLCSDGLSNVISEDEILDILSKNSILSEACDILLKKTLAKGAPDNVTVAVFRK